MSGYPDDITERASLYAEPRGLRMKDRLGHGVHGTVFLSDRPSAVKVFKNAEGFHREHDCYLRLRRHGVLQVLGHHVPQLLDFDSALLVVEMTVVQPPYLLDFAGAYIEKSPDLPDEVIEEWYADKLEQFGADRWQKVQLILATLKGHYGIHLIDVNRNNITFGGGEE